MFQLHPPFFGSEDHDANSSDPLRAETGRLVLVCLGPALRLRQGDHNNLGGCIRDPEAVFCLSMMIRTSR